MSKAAQILEKKAPNITGQQAWQLIQRYLLSQPKYRYDFDLHLQLYELIYPNWRNQAAPAYFPSLARKSAANLTRWMADLKFSDYHELHSWSHKHYRDFWQRVITELNIPFSEPYTTIASNTDDVEHINWLPGAKLNIAQSCFQADANKTAIIYGDEKGLHKISYAELEALSNRVANSLYEHGFHKGDTIAIDMRMDINAIAIYLGIIKAGCVVVSIADSSAAIEVQTRLTISQAKAIFVHDVITRSNKTLPLYTKILTEDLPIAIVIPEQKTLHANLRSQDLTWNHFLCNNTSFSPVPCDPDTHTNILFSSGTTGTPKAIPWTHTTPIKCASDALFHQDIHEDDILCSPTNLGWMMGPRIIFAALVNRATVAIYHDTPNTKGFGRFVQDAGVSILGIVPSIVKNWRSTKCMENLNWERIKTFSSTGECSNPEDMLYLMFLAGYKPIIEYCGGTEIGGGYISSTVLEPNAPSLFTTPAMGLNFVIINDEGQTCDDGEVALLPPSIGLSSKLLNRDHHAEYFAKYKTWNTDIVLRQHGDKLKRLDDGYYRLEGRTDDTMNLGAIKTSSAEIERVLNTTEGIKETAAIGISTKDGGPQQLIIYAVTNENATIEQETLKNNM